MEALRPAFRSQDGSWTAHDAYVGIICFNTAEAQKLGLAAPKSWQDLTDSKYKDKLVMPHPASSGTGYLTVAAWLQLMGEAEAWKFMDALHQNMAVYTHSGSAPCWRRRGSAWPASRSTCAERGRKRQVLRWR